jgi:hypothetical protein
VNERRGSGQRLGSPASFNAQVHARVKEAARLTRLAAVDIRLRPAKASLSMRAAVTRRRV